MMDAFERPLTLVQALTQRAARTPEQIALRFLADQPCDQAVLSYRDLDQRARTIAAALQARAGFGERAVLLFPSGPDYVAAFFGCLYAGVVAVPAYPPESSRPHHQERLRSIIDDAQPRLLLTLQTLHDSLQGLEALERPDAPALLAVDALDAALAADWQAPALVDTDIAFLQYTSGSTALPKGVQISHGNLVANEALIRQGFGIDLNPDDVIVSWLPLYHDMGLIGGLLQPIYSGVPCVLMSPGYFLARPQRWLQAISEYGGTISGGPDFAYRLCSERVSDAALAGLDLSRWRVAYSGSEPIRQDSLDGFAERLRTTGFDPSSFFASYGLAEATLFVSGSRRGGGIAALQVDAQALAAHRIEAGEGSVLMSCGFAQPGHAVQVVEPQSLQTLGENQVGEIWAAGPSIALGYWRNPEASARTFVARDGQTWLRTGDLGFLRDGELFVSGRLKDLLIVRGQNLYPQDLEQTLERQVEGLRKGRVAVFAVEHRGEESIGVAVEVSRSVQKALPAHTLITALRQTVAEACNQAPAVVLLLNPGALPKTSSGKLQRSACRLRMDQGSLDCYARFPETTPHRLLTAGNDNALQRRIAALWCDQLKLGTVAADDHFLLLGGNSIAAAQLTARVADELGVSLSLRTLFEAPTLAAYSAAVAEQLATGDRVPSPITVQSRDQALPQSLAQNRLWLLWQLEPHSAAYNIPAGLSLRGELDVMAVEAAFQALVDRHESLRTVFSEVDGQALQHIQRAAPLHLQQRDLSGLSDAELATQREIEAQQPFDLRQGPLLRVTLVRQDDEQHQLWVTLHHIVADGWSLSILLDEFARLYAAPGSAAQLAALPMGYADHAQWQRQWLANGEAARQLDYWQQQLGDALPVLDLPTDHPRSSSHDRRAARVQVKVPAALGAALDELARSHQASLFMVLLAGWQALLYRYTGQADIRVGVPNANRPRLEAQALVGFFINTQVLRSAVDARLPFTALLEQVRSSTLEAQAHQDLPFEQLLEALPQAREQGLFQVMFNHQQRDLSALRRLPGLLAQELPWHSREAKFDLQLHSEQDHQGRLSLAFDYAAALFEPSTIERLAGHLPALLEQVCAEPCVAVGEVQLLSPAEREQLLSWGQAPVAAPLSLVPEQLNEQARLCAERIALRWDGGSLSYAALHQQANRLAHYLRDKGVGPDTCVAIALERSPQLLVGLLAILKAGGAYVPLDVDYPAERLSYMLEDCGAGLLLSHSTVLERLPQPEGVSVIALDQLHLDNWPSQPPRLHLHGDHLAYVIYTSGSTGRPKGVGNTHAALAERLQWMQAQYALDGSDVLLQKAPVSFDVSVWECFWPLLSGCSLVLAGPGEHRDPQRIAALIQQFAVTTVHFVPPLLQVFLHEPDAAGCHSLRRLFCGGEALPAALRDRALQVLPQVRLDNRYGPTETAINVTHWRCQASDGAHSPIGRPLANVLCRVLDDDLQPTPPGIPGELYLGGAGLARGYLGRPGLTAERFLPDPDGRGQRLYRSGDRARWNLAQQALEYLGRLDQQVKVRGFRVEPEEVEAVLLAQAGVEQALVVIHQDAVGAQLVGYYSGRERTAELLAVLAAQLPAYMVPAHLLHLAAMPVGPSGKLDRRALPAPVWQQREHIAPHTALQRQVADLWSEVLGVAQVGLQDDFFALGGHSLLATQIVSRCRQACDIELPLKALFDASELAAFCAEIQRLQASGQRNRQGEITRIDRRQAVALSHSQQRMWVLWHMEPDSPAYNVGGMARLRGALHVDAFERALHALLARHEALRTTFPSIDGKPVQCVAEHAGLRLGWHDFTALDAQRRDPALQQLADEQAHLPFDLERGPLLRACLVKVAEREHYFVLTLHHIVTEGWAMDIFARELGELYEAFVDERESPLPPLAVQYLDYSVWHRQWLDGGEGARQLAYWKARLGDEHPVLALPSDRPRPAVQSHRGGLYRFDLDPALVQRVHAFNSQHGLTLFMTMTATLAALLHRHSGQRDLRIGAPVANRIRPESEGLIGAFLNTQVLRCEVDGQMSASALLEQMREVIIDGQSHQDLPFEQLVDALQPPRSSAYNPLFQVMCNVQRWTFQQRRELSGMQVDYLVNDASATKFDLYLEVTDLDGRLGCCLTYSRDLFDAPRIARMAEHLQLLLAGLLDDPQQRVCELPMLPGDEQHALIGALHGEPTLDLTHTVHGLFAAQAARTPDARALTFAGQHLSYAELDRQANRLAHALRERGVGPEVRVGLALERSLDLVVGLLAILKAGGAYVPLDPEYPLERLHYLIEDSRLTLLIAQQPLLERLGELPRTVHAWSLEQDRAALADYPATAPHLRSLAQHPAYLIYTSGSTGQPKGVVVSHGEIAMHCQAVIRAFGMRSDDCELHFYSINFDAASERLLVPLLCGARVVLRAQGQWGAEEICQLIREQQVSVLGFTPSYGSQLAQYLLGQGESLPVRLVITGGEALTGEHLLRLRQAFRPGALFNAYGPTETVVMPLACRAPDTLPSDAGSVPIGSMVGARSGYILDEDLALLPQGGIGELYIGGAGLAQGYHDRPGLTAERFVADPFSTQGGRLYRTGDLVRLRADGQVEYIGRADQQVKIRGFRIELGEIESRLQAHPDVDAAVVLALDLPGGKQLVGYVRSALAEADAATQAALREALKVHARQHLPDHMVPAHLVLLAHLPLMGNGKLDRRALPAPDLQMAQQRYRAPSTEVETHLAQVWGEVLNLPQVGVQDNFFELGGDSILSIQVVSRARQLGLQFTPRDLFQHQSIQTLAAVVTVGAAPTQIEQGTRHGHSALTPIQHWFFDSDVPAPQHWNQAVLLQARQPLQAQALQQALNALVTHHDTLRLRFTAQAGRWQAAYADHAAPGAHTLLWTAEVADLEHCDALYTDVQRSLDLADGPLLRGVLVSDGQGAQRLLLAIHHLVVDGVSWRVLLEDLQALYRGQALAAKTHALSDWSARLAHYAGSDSLRDELGWWQDQLGGVKAELPCDHPQGGNLNRHARSVAITLPAAHTQQLLQHAPAAYHTQVNDLLLTALARTLCAWTGSAEALVQLEGHGRDGLFDDIDLTRSVGWFTNAYPLRLSPETGPEDAARGRSLKRIKEQLRQVPHKGQGYGVLRYLADETVREPMAALPQARITFNYLGQFDQQFDDAALFAPVQAPSGLAHDPDAPLPNWLSVDGQVYGGALQLRWTYSSERFDDATVRALAEAYRTELLALVEHCLSEGSGGFTPSDFPLARLSQAQIDALPVPARDIEDVYPLTPMQEGMLLHTLLEPGTGIYYMQDRYRIHSALDPQRFAAAWQAVVARHEALRASFSWNAGEAMVQIIHQPGAVAVDYQDWRELDDAAQEDRLQALHKAEREAGFALLEQPPFHLRLVRVGDARYWFMMSNHHILIDAWCRSLLMNDFFVLYQALGEGRSAQLPAPPRYRDYINWLQHQDLDEARQWWQRNLAGFERATPLPSDRPLRHEHAGEGMVVGDCYTRLDPAQGLQLRELAQAHQLTINTFAQAAWALVLARCSGERDVAFGVTVAGRPVSLPQMQHTVGLFINSVALRVQLPAAGQPCSVRQWLHGLLHSNLELREYEYLPLVAIQDCSELPKGQPLFDSLFVFENAPVQSAVLDHAQQLNARSDSGRTHTNFPLTAVCYPGDDLGLHLSYDQRYFDAPTVERLLAEFKRLLLALAAGIDGDVAALPLLGEAEQRFLLHDCNQTDHHYPLEHSYVQLFEAQVAAHPQRTVARCLEASFDYAGLNLAANRLGHALLAEGVGIDQPVALLAERGLPLLGMIVGSFKAGAGYLPLDPGLPSARLQRIVELSRTPLLVCTAACAEQAKRLLAALDGAARPRLLVWEDVQASAVASHDPGVYSGPDNLAYVIYTSGSTGLPKGVMVEQRGMLNNQLSKVPYLGLSAEDVIAQTASQSFDISVWQFLAAPLFGACVQIVPNAIAHDPQGLLAHVVETGISVLESVPSLIQGMLADAHLALGGLRWMLPTGEAMPPELAGQWLQRYPGIGLVNAYGPAECSDDVAFFRVDVASTEGSYLPIGTPTDNNRLYLYDEDQALVPLGAVGELCVAGTGVGRGYVGDPQRTAQAFVPHPHGAPGERLYRTGDLARRRVDGVLEYVGRIDHQVKIRGYRIELGEIEARLHEQPELRDVAVGVQEGATGKQLVGYLVVAAGSVADSALFETLKARLRAELPEYMVPQHFAWLAQLPHNANGKLDRKALPAVEIGVAQREGHVAPRDALEQALAAIWSDVLKAERVGVRDNFFELGGHSLLATQIASRVQKQLQLNVPLRAMFECNTVEALATYVRGLQASVLDEDKVDRLSDLMAELEAL
ncbi:non-ribosomal peptide synthase/polyketide synthase [Pseudomonas sp. RP23018S]|uniref:non-ribosomal peptide synthase/polyketide synthase n=1 Tax=Pseudomonas sp. RP23018S TaxID=3096037 RepID=UPI002ACB0476|nr:non-ribosomal peptide synthase/polyketide synthase [Pseudomonas sp. RP23018S]MDZ5602339.1 non-ribosomal peptide synthase/polyketide synthase [Pseudomonas sp. RP23018S]